MTQSPESEPARIEPVGTDRSRTEQSNESPAGPPPAIDATGLQLTYADGTEAVQDVTLTVPRGQFFGFLGPNGAGKTTTIKMLATLLEPTGGAARINGYDVTERRRTVRASIGYMAQSVSVDRELSARQNLQFACEAYGVPAADRAERIDQLLSLVDLADVADDPAGTFSGGMQKRLDAATALVHEPQLVFLDEPTTGLDPKARNRLWEYFRRINDGGTTIFLTTQYLAEADALCDRLAVIRDGSIVADGAPAALKRRVGGEVLQIEIADGPAALERATEIVEESSTLGPAASVSVEETTLRITAETVSEYATDVIVALAAAGIDVVGVDVEEPTLDDVFLAIADGGATSLGSATSTDDGQRAQSTPDAPESVPEGSA